ncbi:MAG TPA: hypothetical protein VFC34_12975, partial [Puia sp.]|nr:hypothetical protein [Puia sp.]
MSKSGIVKMGMFLWILGIVLPQGTRSQVKETVDYVNPFIGTEKSSHLTVWEARGATFPGVLLPFGMVQITPDGYMYSDKRIKAFSFLNHHSGWSSHGSFRLIAFTGDVPGDGSAFRHQQERATPYYYRVNLEDYGINADFTATGHAGLCRFKFPQSSSAHLIFSDVSEVKAVGNDQIRGRCGGYFFIASFSRVFQSAGVSVQPSA